MKRVLKVMFIFLIGFLFIIEAKAEGTITLSLSCPSTAKQNEEIVCNIYARVRDNKVKSLTLEGGKKQGPVENVDIDYNTEVSTGDKIQIGTLTAKTTYGGEAVLYVRVKKAVFEDNSEYNNATANAYVTVAQSSDNNLSNLKLDGKTVSGFSKTITNYSVSTTKSSVIISAAANSKTAEVSGTGTKSLVCGSNVYTVNVKAENGAIKNYTLNIKRTCKTESSAEENENQPEEKNKSANLKDITISKGSLSPEFDKNVTSYKVEVDKDVDTITIIGIKENATQKVTGNITNEPLQYGKNQVKITVTSEAGTKKIYTIIVTRKDNRDDNNYLTSISLSSGIINFNKDTLEYETKVLNDIEKIEVLAVPEKETSKVQIEKDELLQVGENIIKIIVTSEKETKREYKIKVIRLGENETLGNNPYISNIKIKNYDLKFEYDKEDYKLVIKDEEYLDIEVIMQDATSTYEIIGNENLKDESVIKIKTTSQDGAEKEYTITVTKTNYLIYYIIFAGLVLLAITIPLVVYLKSVKKRKENLDVNGYKIGKDYEEKDYSRKIISDQNYKSTSNINNTNNGMKEQEIKQTPVPGETQNVIGNSQNQNIIGTQNSQNIIGNTSENKIANQIQNDEQIVNQNSLNQVYTNNINKQNNQNITIQNEFDNELNSYTPNSENKCPNCGRELLGTPDICPYCKNNLK